MDFHVRPAVKRTFLTVLLLSGLSACGGGGDNGNAGGPGPGNTTADNPGSVPASAVASSSAFVAYLNALPANETEDPLNAASVTPPTTDSEEPTDV